MYYYNNSFSPFGMFNLGPLFMIVIWALIIYAVYELIIFFRKDYHHNTHTTTTHNNNAMDILKERYVKGEITKEQFELMKKDIQ